jgi:hypothetical protein
MAAGKRRPDETREMRLVGRLIELNPEVADASLPQFIANRRWPGSDEWSTWDEITHELRDITGEIITDVSLRRWASRYGIPQNTALAGGPVTEAEYAKALEDNNI